MKVQVIVPTAGLGVRLNAGKPKALVFLSGKPLFLFCLQTFEQHPLVDSIILVVPQEHKEEFKANVELFNITKVRHIVDGGKTRCESVLKGLGCVDEDTEIVAVHDGARPFVTKEVIEKAIHTAQKNGAAIVGVPVKPTIKRVNPKDYFVTETVAREGLWEVQTPQVFKREVLFKAHQENDDQSATDDSVLVERIGMPVKMLEGGHGNLKITTPEDLRIAEALLKNNDG
ncbi:MAG: 2-C-methyl-D-erythritol 4-phosphate cytidylyltransferase [Candidatus Omnitrophica bacterium]|nr:2-C-methyl-D-erythritol 4-phosphate cytidylyltransferase [Candidatus Omnitrophota bacterium]